MLDVLGLACCSFELRSAHVKTIAYLLTDRQCMYACSVFLTALQTLIQQDSSCLSDGRRQMVTALIFSLGPSVDETTAIWRGAVHILKVTPVTPVISPKLPPLLLPLTLLLLLLLLVQGVPAVHPGLQACHGHPSQHEGRGHEAR
jgi:hypothetical protein